MNRFAYCLTPYRLPGQHTMILTAEDVAALWNGYLILWHPGVIRCCEEPPRLASPYDHEQPAGPCIYAVPETPPLFLPDDWEERLAHVGALAVRVGVEREVAQAELLEKLGAEHKTEPNLAAFYGLGLGFALLEALCEGMQHPSSLSVGDFWSEVKGAAHAADETSQRTLLQAAAQRLREARESLYTGTIYLLAVVFADELSPGSVAEAFIRHDVPCNILTSAETWQRWAQQNGSVWPRLCQRVTQERLEACAAPWVERPDAMLPVTSQLWNLRTGFERLKAVLPREPQVFGRRRFAYSPAFPAWLHELGLTRAFFLPLEEGVVPEYQATTIEWTSPDGHRVEAITRKPLPGDDPLTYFHIAYHLSKTIREDTTPNLLFLFRQSRCPSLVQDWLALQGLAPVFGEFVTATRLMNEVPIGEYPTPASADDFHSCYLDDLAARGERDPVSRFVRHHRLRRWFDAVQALAALWQALTPQQLDGTLLNQFDKLEEALELGQEIDSSLAGLTQTIMQRLAERLLTHARASEPGHLVFNPCALTRRMVVVLDNIGTPLPAPAKATQPLSGGKAEVVVEVPAFGFAWLPNRVSPGTLVALPKTKLAEGYTLRNEFFEAEVDQQSGGLRSFRDYKWRHNRLGQILAFAPGSQMRAEQIEVVSTGPSRGEIVSRGVLLDGHQNCIAQFQQRFRVWRGYPLLHLEMTLEPAQAWDENAARESPYGSLSPWHAAYVCRWAWRDTSARLFRSVGGIVYPTQHTRPETAEFIEIRTPFSRTAIFTGGLPYLQRHSQRMLDVILLCPGETSRIFELALGLELETPGQLALQWLTPSLTLPVTKGPPHVGTTGWLAWIDAANVVLVSLRVAPDASPAWLVRLQETHGVATECRLRCPRVPVHACVVNEWGQPQHDLAIEDDAVRMFLGAGELVHLRVEFA